MHITDLKETQWQYSKNVLHLQERKRKYSLHSIWDALFYLVKTGCQWRMLPTYYPPWQYVICSVS
ncbi:MAG: transposase [Tannerellaceae bacterium]|nr:transposase [Tannerellaceae bacterium]